MEEIYNDAEDGKSHHLRPLTNQTGSRSSERRLTVADFLCLGVLSVFLVIGLIGLGVHYYTSVSSLTEERDQLKTNLNEMTEERDELKTNLNEMIEENNNLQSLSKKKTTCPAGWTKLCCSCYFFSTESGSWTTGRDDCRTRGADLVVIDSSEEQIFLSTFVNSRTWIGLNDIDEEGTWKEKSNQPYSGSGDKEWGEEDCVYFSGGHSSQWNDYSCEASLPWICEKTPQP